MNICWGRIWHIQWQPNFCDLDRKELGWVGNNFQCQGEPPPKASPALSTFPWEKKFVNQVATLDSTFRSLLKQSRNHHFRNVCWVLSTHCIWCQVLGKASWSGALVTNFSDRRIWRTSPLLNLRLNSNRRVQLSTSHHGGHYWPTTLHYWCSFKNLLL
jgi:hypothetical protein